MRPDIDPQGRHPAPHRLIEADRDEAHRFAVVVAEWARSINVRLDPDHVGGAGLRGALAQVVRDLDRIHDQCCDLLESGRQNRATDPPWRAV